MVARYEDDEAMYRAEDAIEPRIVGDIGDDDDVGLVAKERDQDFFRIADRQGDMDPRVTAGEGGEERHDVIGAVGADPQMPGRQLVRPAEQLTRLLFEEEQSPGDLEQRLAERRRDDAPAAAVEQRHPIALLERLHLRRERRLCYPEPQRGAGEAAFRRDGVKGTEIGMIHRRNRSEI